MISKPFLVFISTLLIGSFASAETATLCRSALTPEIGRVESGELLYSGVNSEGIHEDVFTWDGGNNGKVFRVEGSSETYVVKVFNKRTGHSNDVRAFEMLRKALVSAKIPSSRLRVVKQVDAPKSMIPQLELTINNKPHMFMEYERGSVMRSVWSQLSDEVKNQFIEDFTVLIDELVRRYEGDALVDFFDVDAGPRGLNKAHLKILLEGGYFTSIYLHNRNFLVTEDNAFVIIDPF